MARAEIHLIPALKDNYNFVIHDLESKKTCVIDPSLSEPLIQFLDQKAWSLDLILNTHHHWDHTDGNLGLLQKYPKASLYCSEFDLSRIQGAQRGLKHKETFALGSQKFEVASLPGHTLGQIGYSLPSENAFFCGDTLFSMGCGRLFEGTPEQMFESLNWIKTLNPKTQLYGGHEYSEKNFQFAIQFEPNNQDLIKRGHEVQSLRAKNQATVPSFLETELKTNPFFRCDSQEIKASLKLESSSPIEVFTELRRLRNSF